MQLNKRDLASRTLKVGKDRIHFVRERLDEIKEAITKQDVRQLVEEGAIKIKPVKGRRTNTKRRNKRGKGKVKKKVNTRKQDYVKMTRKLRSYVKAMKGQGKLTSEEIKEIRKGIRNKQFKSKANLKLYMGELEK